MHIPTAPSLLLGLGARILAQKFFTAPDAEPRISSFIISGLWQGVLLYHALMQYPDLAFGVGFGIAARLAIDYILVRDTLKTSTTILGAALGVLATDILSQFLEDGDTSYDSHISTSSNGDAFHSPTQRHPDRHSSLAARTRLVQFRRSVDGESRSSRRRLPTESAPSLASSDTLDPAGTMSPLEREIAALRRRAALADSERRRYREERKWAVSQGNEARAAQMSWQVKRYTALTNSFNREADARVVERDRQVQSSSRARVAGEAAGKPRAPRHPSQEVAVESRPSVSVNIGRHRKQSSGNLRSAVHVQVR